jgi:hypothetical protein
MSPKQPAGSADFSIGDDVEVLCGKYTGWLGKVVTMEGMMIVSIGVLLDRPPRGWPQQDRNADIFGPGQLWNATRHSNGSPNKQ